MFSVLIGLFILGIPLILGPLRKGIANILLSVMALISYSSLVMTLYNEAYDGNFEFPIRMAVIESWNLMIRMDIIIAIILFGSMLVTLICFLIENTYQEGKKEAFYDERLFYRYGQRVKADVIPIGVKHLQKSTDELGRNLYFQLSKNMKTRFGANKRFSTELISVSDSNLTNDIRLFLKLNFTTIRGSRLSYFVNLTSVGNQIAINSLAYIKSKYEWHHVLRFVIASPWHYWAWVYHWLMKKYSLQSRIGNTDVANTFEKLDLEAFLKSATFTIMASIEDFAKENNLLTEELRQLIINNINNTQNINIRKSRGIKIGRLRISTNPYRN